MGSAIAERLAADGHTVAVADLRLDTAVEAAARVTDAGGVALPLEMDVSEGGSVAFAIAEAERELGTSRAVSTRPAHCCRG